MTKIKICGLRDETGLNATVVANADFIGFVFYPPSPRHIEIETAAKLCRALPNTATPVGLFVNPDDDTLTCVLDTVPLGMIQLHGNETPQRVADIKQRFNLPVMKAIRVASKDDLQTLNAYEDVCDWILFDARHGDTPGGTGETFDWDILSDITMTKPWMLAGGLNADNVKIALSSLSPTAVDVSSGVESTRGVKDACKIAKFVESVRSCKNV